MRSSNLAAMHSYSLLLITLFLLFGCSSTPEHQQKLSGLEEPVEIIRDQWGINHIYAENQHDLFFAQGYAAAKDRLFQFEIWRRQATGTVAELLGPRELKRDIGTRLFKYRGDPDSEFYYNLFDSWTKDQYFPVLYSRDRIEKAASEKFLLLPK